MFHLNSSFIERVNTPEVKECFLTEFGDLLALVTNYHISKDKYHDVENIIGVGYITMLMVYYYNGLTLNNIKDNVHIVKTAILQNYCFANKSDDRENVAITIDEINRLTKTYKNIISSEDKHLIKIYISLTDKTCSLNIPPVIDFFSDPRALIRQILLDSYNLYPALCFNTKILNNLYLDEKVKRDIDFEEFKNQKLIDFCKLNGEKTTSFCKIVYKEIKSQLEFLCRSA